MGVKMKFAMDRQLKSAQVYGHIAAAMSTDEHENDVVMPGFRFHPTEEELIEFYLRRKVEGKRFNTELIPFLDLYRYDPWELPTLATIGEKEWYFYVPRDRKYRNSDRPNRVTISGYWKATGADRMIRSENSRPIGLKKTLVFYSGKAPRGIRTSWIMNEYRLPQSGTDQYEKAEISLCRVYRRPGVDVEPCQIPGVRSSRTNGSDSTHNMGDESSSNFKVVGGVPSSSKITNTHQFEGCNTEEGTPLRRPSTDTGPLVPMCGILPLISLSTADVSVDELSRLIAYNKSYLHEPNHFLSLLSQPQLLPLTRLPPLPTISDKLWEWNPLITEAERDLV